MYEINFPILNLLEAMGKRLINHFRFGDVDSIKCDKCKGSMVLQAEKLYLIPCWINDEHEESDEYYAKYAYPINDLNDIPIGQRACYVRIFFCEECGNFNVNILDFLQVRDKQIAKGGGIYPIDKLRHLIQV